MAKSKWDDVKEKIILIEAWARDGLIDTQIAERLGISKDTFYKYKNEHADFSDSLKRGKEIVDVTVENALLKKATGYYYTETVVASRKEVTYSENGKRLREAVEPVEFEITKYAQPDTTAQIFWLKNRKPDKWKDKQQVEHSGEINNPFCGLTTDELKKLIHDG